MSIVGFDNAPLGRYLYPKLSTINNPVTGMGRMAAHWVLQHVYDKSGLDIQHEFEPERVTRDSVAPVPT